MLLLLAGCFAWTGWKIVATAARLDSLGSLVIRSWPCGASNGCSNGGAA